MTYVFKELCAGPRWRVIRDGFVRKSQAEAFAIDWFYDHDYDIICSERDTENDSIDYMTVKGTGMYQYAVEPCKA